METAQVILNQINSFVWGWVLIVMLVGTGLYLTVRMGFVQIRQFFHSLNVISGKYDNPKDEGDISHFQALSAALSATIGIGNIAGVATAIHWGGPGALFWMWVTGFVGMATKYTTCTLSHKFRVIHPDGSASGGPMYYIEKGLGSNWKILAILFALFTAFTSFSTPNMVQSNTVAVTLERDFGIPTYFTGIVLSILVALVIIGGIRRIAQVASRLVPFMCVFYVLGAMTILIINYDSIIPAFKLIFAKAFTRTGKIGGFYGSVWFMTMEWGVKRGLFSNEAGLGSAPIAHAAAKTKESAREGIVAMIGPFIDTILICTMTGLVLVTTGVWKDKFDDTITPKYITELTIFEGSLEDTNIFNLDKLPIKKDKIYVENGRITDNVSIFREKGTIENPLFFISYPEGKELYTGKIDLDDNGKIIQTSVRGGTLEIRGKMLLTGAELTAQGFSRGLPGKTGNYIVSLGVVLFAFSTALSWSYYGDRSVGYLFGRRGIMPYRYLFVGFIFLGSIFTLNMVWTIGDIAMALMAFPNLIAVLILSRYASNLTREYTSRKHEPFKKK